MVPDNDVSSIFEKHTIKEIEQILFKTRNDIEKKKEDLRVMVGERYRDLIEAADTISDMQKSAESICKNIDSMETLCSSLRQRGLIGFKTHALPNNNFNESNHSSLHQQYIIAIQVKVLVDAPEILWTLIEKREFLSATQLLLLAQQVHTALQLSPNASKIMSSFPVISQQWSIISQFKSVIIKGCTSLIQLEVHNYKNVECALVSLILLEGSGMLNAMKTFLNLRKIALQSILIAKSVKITKTQLVQFIEAFIAACNILHKIFVGNEKCSCNLEVCIERVCGKGACEDHFPLPLKLLEDVSSGLKFMPKVVAEFRPSFPPNCVTLEMMDIQEEVWCWMDTIVLNGAENITKLLTCITSIKSLSMIRMSVAESQKTCIDQQKWIEITSSLLGDKVFNPWNRTIYQPITKRAKQIISNELAKASSSFVKMLTDLVKEINKNPKVCQEEGDIGSFIWSEMTSDVLLEDRRGTLKSGKESNSNSLSYGKGLNENSGLFYKSHGYTKRIQTLCKVLDGKLQILLQDVLNYRPEHLNGNAELSNSQEIDSQNDYLEILEYLESSTLEVFQKTFLQLDELSNEYSHVKNIEDEYAESPLKYLSGHLCIQIIISRLCHALPTVCNQLKICCISSLLANADSARRLNVGFSIETPTWVEFKKDAYRISANIMTDILVNLTSKVSEKLKPDLIDVINSGNIEEIISIFPAWEKVLIKEESDSGDSVDSVIYVPLHLSPQISQNLMNLCSSINCIGAHTISRSSHCAMVNKLCLEIISSYESLNDECFAKLLAAEQQKISFQLIFDLKLIQTMFLPRENKDVLQRFFDLIQKLEKRVDPFDFDVFQPHLNARIKQATHRLHIIFGSILPLERSQVSTKSVSHQSTSSVNNCLTITPALEIPRFSNVPIPSNTSNFSATFSDSLSMSFAHTLQFNKENDATNGDNSKASTTSRAAPRTASSLFSAMSSSWFGVGS